MKRLFIFFVFIVCISLVFAADSCPTVKRSDDGKETSIACKEAKVTASKDAKVEKKKVKSEKGDQEREVVEITGGTTTIESTKGPLELSVTKGVVKYKDKLYRTVSSPLRIFIVGGEVQFDGEFDVFKDGKRVSRVKGGMIEKANGIQYTKDTLLTAFVNSKLSHQYKFDDLVTISNKACKNCIHEDLSRKSIFAKTNSNFAILFYGTSPYEEIEVVTQKGKNAYLSSFEKKIRMIVGKENKGLVQIVEWERTEPGKNKYKKTGFVSIKGTTVLEKVTEGKIDSIQILVRKEGDIYEWDSKQKDLVVSSVNGNEVGRIYNNPNAVDTTSKIAKAAERKKPKITSKIYSFGQSLKTFKVEYDQDGKIIAMYKISKTRSGEWEKYHGHAPDFSKATSPVQTDNSIKNFLLAYCYYGCGESHLAAARGHSSSTAKIMQGNIGKFTAKELDRFVKEREYIVKGPTNYFTYTGMTGGQRSFAGSAWQHQAVADSFGPVNEDIVSPRRGTVTKKIFLPDYMGVGHSEIIVRLDKEPGKPAYFLRILHFGSFADGIEKGTRVKQGTPLVKTGSIGVVRSVPHAHFNVYKGQARRGFEVRDPIEALENALTYKRGVDTSISQRSSPVATVPNTQDTGDSKRASGGFGGFGN